MDNCIEWPHGKHQDGYGTVQFGGKTCGVHRLVYRLYHDLNEDEMPRIVRHKCDNPSCYNINHLEGGNHSDNATDCVERGRHPYANKTHCIRGHLLPERNDKGWRYCKECKIMHNKKRSASLLKNYQSRPEVKERRLEQQRKRRAALTKGEL